MNNTLILYSTVYGSTQGYAEELARRLDTTAHTLDDAPALLESNPEVQTVIVLSPVFGPAVAGATFIKDSQGLLQGRRVALASVGMTLTDHARDKDSSARLLGDAADATTRFYLPGRLYYSEISRVHKGVLWSIVNMLKGKINRNANDNNMIDTYNTDVDRVDYAELDAIAEWVRG